MQSGRDLVLGVDCVLQVRHRANRSLRRELQPRYLVAVHLVRAVGQSQRARLCVGVRQWEILAHSPAAVCLDRPVDHSAAHVPAQENATAFLMLDPMPSIASSPSTNACAEDPPGTPVRPILGR
jgi:hypothetical protein